MVYIPKQSELEFLQELNEQHGYTNAADALEEVLDIAAFESTGNTSPEVKAKMYLVKQMIKSMRSI